MLKSLCSIMLYKLIWHRKHWRRRERFARSAQHLSKRPAGGSRVPPRLCSVNRVHTMVLKFNEAGIKNAVEELPSPLRVAFAALCAERLIRAYEACVKESDKWNLRL